MYRRRLLISPQHNTNTITIILFTRSRVAHCCRRLQIAGVCLFAALWEISKKKKKRLGNFGNEKPAETRRRFGTRPPNIWRKRAVSSVPPDCPPDIDTPTVDALRPRDRLIKQLASSRGRRRQLLPVCSASFSVFSDAFWSTVSFRINSSNLLYLIFKNAKTLRTPFQVDDRSYTSARVKPVR